MTRFTYSNLRKIIPLFLCPTGYFTQISTLADVQENVMEYLHVLSRPKVIDREHDTVWTEAYIDSTVSRLCSHLSLSPVPTVHLNLTHPADYVSKNFFLYKENLIHNALCLSLLSKKVHLHFQDGWIILSKEE